MGLGNKDNVHIYQNVSEYLDREAEPIRNSRESFGDMDWDDGVSAKQAAEYARNGYPKTLSDFQSDVIQLESNNGAAERHEWERSVAGPRVCVGEFLTGAPNHMRQRRRRETNVRHINVYVSLVCSAGIQAKTMLKRGATILAFLDYLQRTGVNVDLYLVSDMHGNGGDHTQVIRVESRPLNLSQSGFVIAHPAFTRNVTYAVGRKYGFNGRWSSAYSKCGYSATPPYVQHMRERLGMAEKDVFIPPVYLRDTIVEQPDVWLKERIAQLEA